MNIGKLIGRFTPFDESSPDNTGAKDRDETDTNTEHQQTSPRGTPLEEVWGIGETYAAELEVELDVTSAEELAEINPEEASRDVRFSEYHLRKLVARAQVLVDDEITADDFPFYVGD